MTSYEAKSTQNRVKKSHSINLLFFARYQTNNTHKAHEKGKTDDRSHKSETFPEAKIEER